MIALLLIGTILAFNNMAIGQEVGPPQGKCPANSTMSGCGNRCTPKCGDPSKPCLTIKICDPPACACAEGYARNSSGQCVLVADCKKCPANSTMSGCGNRCEAKCGDPPGGKPCVKICDPPACACAKGYARNSNGQCVLVADCNEVSPNDDPCAVVRCRGGTHCVPRPVQCKKAPCRPRAECVPNEDVCAAVDCVSGYVCVPHEVQCIRAPCPPIAECVPASSASSRADGGDEADSDDDD